MDSHPIKTYNVKKNYLKEKKKVWGCLKESLHAHERAKAQLWDVQQRSTLVKTGTLRGMKFTLMLQSHSYSLYYYYICMNRTI